MPCISISLGGIRRSQNRVFNKIYGSWWAGTNFDSASGSYWTNLLQPVPVDITVNVSILARFQSDIDQIVANFVPYTDPYFVISWRWPDSIPFSDFEIRSHVKWNESINFNYPNDFAKEVPYWTNADTSFTIEGWMFKNQPPDGKPIYVIEHSFMAVSAIDTPSLMKTFENEYNTDYRVISARPQSMNIDPYYSYLGTTTIPYEKKFTIMGKMLDYVDSVYLSSADWNMFNYTSTGDFLTGGPSFIDYFSVSSFYASAAYPGFSAVQLNDDKWNIIDKNYINFSFTPLSTGTFDVILLNRAGYSILSKDTVRPTLNPYSSGSFEYNNYVEYQYPCVSGIEIRSV